MTDAGGTRLWERMRFALLVAALLLGVHSWVFGRWVGTSRIFNSRHKVLMVEFADFEAALQSQVRFLCATNSVHHIYFDQNDVALIGILDEAGRNPRCRVVRESPVTLLPADALEQCSAVVVKESYWSQAFGRVELPDSGAASSGMVSSVSSLLSPISRWRSPAGDFGFNIYRNTSCNPLVQRLAP